MSQRYAADGKQFSILIKFFSSSEVGQFNEQLNDGWSFHRETTPWWFKLPRRTRRVSRYVILPATYVHIRDPGPARVRRRLSADSRNTEWWSIFGRSRITGHLFSPPIGVALGFHPAVGPLASAPSTRYMETVPKKTTGTRTCRVDQVNDVCAEESSNKHGQSGISSRFSRILIVKPTNFEVGHPPECGWVRSCKQGSMSPIMPIFVHFFQS